MLRSTRCHARPNTSRLLPTMAALLVAMVAAADVPPLRQMMADPDWIGSPVQASWWQLDGKSGIYRTRRAATDRSDLFTVDLTTGEARLLDYAGQTDLDGPAPYWTPHAVARCSCAKAACFCVTWKRAH
jgi:hypothetical protein